MISFSIKNTLFIVVVLISISIVKCGTCDEDEYFCIHTIKCIDSDYLCDGDNDCGDDSDEAENLCYRGVVAETVLYEISETPDKCDAGEFYCNDIVSKCITITWVCDGDHDCDSGRDEDVDVCYLHFGGTTTTKLYYRTTSFYTTKSSNALTSSSQLGPITTQESTQRITQETSDKTTLCAVGTFLCEDQMRCIPQHWICDGEKDCRKGQDEDLALCGLVKTFAPLPGTYPSSPETTIYSTSSRYQESTFGITTRFEPVKNEENSKNCTSEALLTCFPWIAISAMAIFIIAVVVIISIIVVLCKKRKSRTVSLNQRNRNDNSVAFLNNNLIPECQLVLVGTPVQVQPTVIQSTNLDQPPPYNTQSTDFQTNSDEKNPEATNFNKI